MLATKALLLYQPTQRRRHQALEVPKIDLFVHGNLVPVVENVRVLGLKIKANGQNLETVRALEKSVHQMVRLITRIANKDLGMKEANLVRLVEAFVPSRIVYVTPVLRLRADERIKVNTMNKKAYKQALGIPVSAPNKRCEALGIHNTLDELREVQRVAQPERLTKSSTGRHILRSQGINYEAQFVVRCEISRHVRDCMHVPPLRRHMHPVHNVERRRERAKSLHRRLEKSDDVVYVDAVEYVVQEAITVVAVDCKGKLVAGGKILTSSPEAAEEAAIALAMVSSEAKLIV